MTLTLLLVLAGLLATDEPRSGPTLSCRSGAQPAAVQAARSEQPFGIAPLQLGNPGRKGPFQLAKTPRLAVRSKQASPGMTQLRNRRTGVTCTMRIVRVEPSVDPGILASTMETRTDPMVRNELSPCVE